MTILTSFDCFNSLWRKNGNNYSVYRPRKWNTFKTESHARKYCVSVCAAFNILLQFFIESVCNMCLTHSKGCVSAGHEEKLRSLRFVSLSQLRNFIYTHAQTHTGTLVLLNSFLKKKKEKIGTRTKVCQAYMPQCAGNLPRRWQRRSRAEKGEKGEREVGVRHGSLQIFCVSVCVFGNKWYPRWKNVTLCPVFCDTLFKLQEKNKNKGGRKVTN